jgi:hypothetical protein
MIRAIQRLAPTISKSRILGTSNGAGAIDRIAEIEVFEHLQLCKRHVDAIQISTQITKEQERQ